MSIIIKISNIADVNSVSSESFKDGDVRSIEFWSGFTFGNLLQKIVSIMQEKGCEDFNCERILFYSKEGERFDFGCDDTFLNNGDYINVGIIEDNEDQIIYAHH